MLCSDCLLFMYVGVTRYPCSSGGVTRVHYVHSVMTCLRRSLFRRGEGVRAREGCSVTKFEVCPKPFEDRALEVCQAGTTTHALALSEATSLALYARL